MAFSDLARRRRWYRQSLLLTAMAAVAPISLVISRLRLASPGAEEATIIGGSVEHGAGRREVRGTDTLVSESAQKL